MHATSRTSGDAAGTGLVPAIFTLARRLRRAAGQPELDVAALMLLHRLACSGPARTSDLAVELDLDPSTVSRHATALAQQGLITRDDDPTDRRARALALTTTGTALLEDSFDRRERAVRAATAAWSAADVAMLHQLLTRLADDLDTTATETL